jgi:predicted transcriptional regulator
MECQEIRQQEDLRQLKAKLDRGAAQAERGDLLDGEAVFAELRDLIEERRAKAGQT